MKKLNNKTIIKTVGEDQEEIISNILKLYNDSGVIELDPTYSKGAFYKSGTIGQPLEKFDILPQTKDTLQADACDLPHLDNQVASIMFDPPFIVGFTKPKPTGIIGERFHGFKYIKDLWEWYSKCLEEFHRILQDDGLLIFKCQDTVSSGKQHLSHVHVITEAQRCGFYVKDLFVLTAKNRVIGHNHHTQKHARKFHSYFLVMIKEKTKTKT